MGRTGKETWRKGDVEGLGMRANEITTAVRQETRDDIPIQRQDPGQRPGIL